jgi:hypothetical protein
MHVTVFTPNEEDDSGNLIKSFALETGECMESLVINNIYQYLDFKPALDQKRNQHWS